jgi:hypothetical protein
VTARRDLAALLGGAALILAIVFGLRAYDGRHAAPTHKPDIYIVSASRVCYPDDDYWLIAYTMDGKSEVIQLPTYRDPEDFLAYLGRIGTLEGRSK